MNVLSAVPRAQGVLQAFVLRPVAPDDEAVVRRVFAAVRERELGLLPPDQQALFLNHQLGAQRADYRRRYPDAREDLILRDGEPAGRLFTARTPDALRVLDLALLPEQQGRGLGTAVVRALQREAGDRPLRGYTESFNPACRWLERLGFRRAGALDVHVLFEWHADLPTAPFPG